jgi:hypothetical protein
VAWKYSARQRAYWLQRTVSPKASAGLTVTTEVRAFNLSKNIVELTGIHKLMLVENDGTSYETHQQLKELLQKIVND